MATTPSARKITKRSTRNRTSAKEVSFPQRIVAEAAHTANKSVDDFVHDAVLSEARRVLREQNIIVMNDTERDQFLELLENPPKPNTPLRDAAKRWQHLRQTGQLQPATATEPSESIEGLGRG